MLLENSLKPDAFVILKASINNETIYKLFSCWYGGYLESDSWRLNSGITKIEFDEESLIYTIYSNSSTIYQVHKSTFNKLSSYCSRVLADIMQGHIVNIISIDDYIKETQN